MNNRYAHLPVVFMPVPRPPARIRRLRWSKRRAVAWTAAAAALLWWGTVEAVTWISSL